MGGAQRPFRHVNEPKKTGARSARARTRGQNPLVSKYGCGRDFSANKLRIYIFIERGLRIVRDIDNIRREDGMGRDRHEGLNSRKIEKIRR